MLYFLVIIIPFAAYMAYLIHQNNILKKQLKEILQGLKKASSILSVKESALFEELEKKSYLVTSNSIKRTEHFITALEDVLEIERQKVVSNTFKPKAKKLEILHKRQKSILKKLNKKEAVVPMSS